MHRYGQARSLVVLTCTEPAFLLLYAVSPNVLWAIVFIAVLGAIHTAAHSLFLSIVQCYAEPAVRSRVIAISRAFVVPTYAISSTILGVVATNIGLRITFAAMACVAIACLAFVGRGRVNQLGWLAHFERPEAERTLL
jgi:MFS family permease